MPSRPQSAAANPINSPSSAPPAPPAAPPAPAPPAAPKAPTNPISSTSAAPPPRGMLLGEIQSGKRLRKAQTNDRSSSSLADEVEDKRRSVDWMGGMAADGMRMSIANHHQSSLQSHAEEPTPKPEETPADDATENFDVSQTIRVRSLYPYTAQGDNDLTMEINLILKAHPSKVDEDWLYGTIESTGQSGTFPKSYVEEIKVTWGKALYDYSPTSSDEAPLVENTQVPVLDSSDLDWFKIEDNGMVRMVPAAYIQLDN
ncbi:hypothetical protein KEM48_000443 [Puccinia striiformis f. sp. tritici PST-130]|nr:hypothetical protein KEM48_000443 [Puccinia striiformis f. sp. tritici PST-130]